MKKKSVSNTPFKFYSNSKFLKHFVALQCGVGKSTERAYHYVHRPEQSDRPFALDVAHHGGGPGGAERGITTAGGGRWVCTS